jgi:hypothetical protein
METAMQQDTNSIYKAPKANLATNNLPIEDLNKILKVAKRQKALVYTFLAYFFAAALQAGLPQELKIFSSLIVFPVWIAIIIFNARLCLLVYGRFTAVLLIILGIIPLINFLVVLAASSRANKLIKTAGFKVGFLGANTKTISQAMEQATFN